VGAVRPGGCVEGTRADVNRRSLSKQVVLVHSNRITQHDRIAYYAMRYCYVMRSSAPTLPYKCASLWQFTSSIFTLSSALTVCVQAPRVGDAALAHKQAGSASAAIGNGQSGVCADSNGKTTKRVCERHAPARD
jgi:hypothetical protein